MASSRGSAIASFAAWSPRGRRRVRSCDEGAERLQVLFVPGVAAREFEAARNLAELLLVHQEPERLLPQFPLPHVLVSIEVRSQIAHRVVQVKRADSSQADRLADRAEECVVALPRSEVVARGKGVARVDADSKAGRMHAPVDDLTERLDPAADH